MKKAIKKTLKLMDFIMPPVLMYMAKGMFLLLWKPSTWRVSIHKYNKKYPRLMVIGNGPSLNESIDRLADRKKKFDLMAVNGFACSRHFEDIKPNMYVLSDPVYFLEKDKLSTDTKEIVDHLEDSLRKKAKWDIAVFVPNYGKDSVFVKNIKKNTHISMFYFNMHDHFAPKSERLKYFLWDRNWIALAGQTVLNTCVNLGIILRYKEIDIIGADTSWHEQLRVDQENNKIYTIDKHFYGERKVYLYADPYGMVPERLDRELVSISKALSSYWDLKGYAEKRGIRIYNASFYSDIDAFPRRTFENVGKKGDM